MARSVTDRNRLQSNPDARLARRTAKALGQAARQRDAEDAKLALKTWIGQRTGTNG